MRRPNQLSEAVGVACSALFVLLLLRVVETLTPFQLSHTFGIVPRTGMGLIGILTAPLLHGNWAHLVANALPLFVLMTLLYWDKHNDPERTLGMIWLASGAGTWLIGRPASHIGASSIVFGLVSYLIMAGVWAGRWRSFFVGLAVFFFFGGIFIGVLPGNPVVSWEGHLCGAIAGIWAAKKNYLD